MAYRKIVFSVAVIAAIVLGLSMLDIETVAEHEKKLAESDEPPIVIIEDDTGVAEAPEIQGTPEAVEPEVHPTESEENAWTDDGKDKTTSTPTLQPDKGEGKGDVTVTAVPTSTPVLTDKPNPGITTAVPTVMPTKKPTKRPTNTPAATPAESEKKEEYISVTFKIGCENVLGDEALKTDAVIPEDGIWFDGKIKVKSGSNVYQVLKAVCEAKNIKYVNESGESSAYISSIGGLKAFECGKESGWKYKVNGYIPNVGSSDYYLSDGDCCEWYYVKNIME